MKLKLKLTNLHLFLILLFVLIISALGFNIVEGMQDNSTSSALPKGIKREQIPEGSEDLYILKSEVVPPVRPKCPDIKSECKDVKRMPTCHLVRDARIFIYKKSP